MWAWTHWPVRKRGLVRTSAGIPLYEVDLWGVLVFHREDLVRVLRRRGALTRAQCLDRIAAAVVKSIESAARGYSARPRPPHLRKSEVRLTARYGALILRLKIQRDHLPSWVHIASADRPRLIRIIREQFFPDALVNQVIRGRPRGPQARAPLLLAVARVALFSADELVRRGSPAQVDRLRQWLQTEGWPAHNSDPRDIAAALTQRTLEPAWEKFKVTRPSERSPDQLYADWISPKKHEHLRAARRVLESTIKPWNRDLPSEEDVRWTWEERLTLDPPGQAAKDFHLY